MFKLYCYNVSGIMKLVARIYAALRIRDLGKMHKELFTKKWLKVKQKTFRNFY